MSKVILFNGPRDSGKSAAVDQLLYNFHRDGIVRRECKSHLHKLVPMFFNIPEEDYWYWYANKDEKEIPREELTVFTSAKDLVTFEEILKESVKVVGLSYPMECHLSLRQAMIYVSEVICKPSFGKDYFGKVRASSITKGDNIVIDDSCGFIEELIPLTDKIPKEDILLVRIHREGYDFTGDSRRYIQDEEVDFKTIDVYNDGTEVKFLKEISSIYLGFIDSKVSIMDKVYYYRFGSPSPDITLLLKVGDNSYKDLYFNHDLTIEDNDARLSKPSRWSSSEIKKVEEYYNAQSNS